MRQLATIPASALRIIREQVESGAADYNSLNENAKSQLMQSGYKPPAPSNALVDQGVFNSVEPEAPKPSLRLGQAFESAVQEAPGYKLLAKGLRKADELLGFAPPAPKPEFKPQGLEWAPYLAGKAIGEAPTVGLAYLTGGAGAAALTPEASALISSAPSLSQLAARGAGAGLTHGLFRQAVENTPLSEGIPNVALETAGFAVGDPALSFLGRQVGAFLRPEIGAIRKLDFTKPAPPAPEAPPPRLPFKTATPDYTINNARSFEGGKGFSSVPDYGYSSGYLEAPARSGGMAETIAFPPPLPEPPLSRPAPRQLRMPDYSRQAMDDLQAGVETAQNYVKHNDILAAYPPGTTVEQAFADIKAKTGIDLPQLMAGVERAMARPGLRQAAGQQAQYVSLRAAAGLSPEKIGRTGKPVRTIGAPKPPQGPQFPLPFNRVEEPAVQAPKPFERNLDFPGTGRGLTPELPPLTPEPPKVTPKLGAPIKPEAKGPTPDDVTQLKDLGGWRLYMTDIYRNVKDVFGKGYDKVKAEILDPFDASKKSNVDEQEVWLNRLKSEVVDKLGIQKGSKESALVQMFGEKKITLDELKQRAPDKWQNIVEADQWFRKAYKELLGKVNESRRQIYPNVEADMAKIDKKIEAIKNAPRMKGESKQAKIKELQDRKEEIYRNRFVPERQDYYRHFRDLSGSIGGLRNIFDSPANISPSLSGISEFTLPKSKWASFMQKRGMGPYKDDAVGGFLNYIPAASHAIHIDPHIGKFEKLADSLAEATADTGNLNNFIEYLRDYSRDLAGKTNPVDRFLQKVIPGGRKAFAVIDWLNNRVKANVILGNAASALAQIANVPQGMAFTKQYSVPGMGRALASIFVKNEPITKSGFIKERYGSMGGAIYRQFDVRLLDQPNKLALWVMETADKMGTHFIWNSAYEKGLAQKVADPIKYADDVTRRMVAGRGVGEVPIIQKSKVFQLIAPFQLEVGNLWSVMRDFVKEKDFGALVLLAVGSYAFNKGAEATRGSGVTFDPIQAMVETLAKDKTLVERGGRLAGEVLSNIPLGQTVASAYPEYGGEVLGYKMPTRKKFFGREDPTRFGTGLLVQKGLKDPFKVLPPFGGSQLKKTIEGVQAARKGAVYTSDGTEIKYPIAKDTINTAKGVLFGPGGFREAKDYYDNNRRPLSEKQTEQLKGSGNNPQLYQQMQFKRQVESIDRQISEVRKDKKMSQQERDKKVRELIAKRNELMQKRGR